MKREFLINIIFLITINLLIKPVYIFLIDRGVQNAVEPGSYGLYFTMFNFAYLFQMILDMGLQNFNNQSLSADKSLIRQYLPNILFLKLFTVLVFWVVLFFTVWIIGYPSSYYKMIIGVGWIHVGLTYLLYLRTNISGMGYYRTDSFMSILDKALLIGVVGFLLFRNDGSRPFDIMWFVNAQIATLTLTIIIALIISIRISGGIDLKIDPRLLKQILKKSFPFALASFLMFAYAKVDSVMLGKMLPDGLTEAENYAGGWRILNAGNMVGFLFVGLLFPMMSNMISKGENVNSITRLGFLLLFSLVSCIAIPISIYSQDISDLLYPQGDSNWGEVLRILMYNYIVITLIFIYGTVLTASARLKWANVVFALGFVINVLLNYIFIPQYKAIGASWVTLVTHGFVAIGLIIICIRLMKFRIDLKLILILVLFLACFYMVNYYIEKIDLLWIYRFMLGIISGLILAFIFRLIPLFKFGKIIAGKS
jgi:O-antigen/teichoic acid export membrane protein